ncbi:hypothetical protein JTB14_030741 [Gonioctena quinquepunctata]|nr:hypothetical protein JTB14_030741 [Gonioctena quinquepunctata]
MIDDLISLKKTPQIILITQPFRYDSEIINSKIYINNLSLKKQLHEAKSPHYLLECNNIIQTRNYKANGYAPKKSAKLFLCKALLNLIRTQSTPAQEVTSINSSEHVYPIQISQPPRIETMATVTQNKNSASIPADSLKPISMPQGTFQPEGSTEELAENISSPQILFDELVAASDTSTNINQLEKSPHHSRSNSFLG